MELKIEELSGEQQRIAEAIGIEAYLKLSKQLGGTTIYIAKAEDIAERRNRDEKILAEFDGANFSQLAAKYGLSEVWIRSIVCDKAKEIKQRPIEGQMSLDDFLKSLK